MFGDGRRTDSANVESGFLKLERNHHGPADIADNQRHDLGTVANCAERFEAVGCESGEVLELLLPVATVFEDFERRSNACSHQWRRRCRENEGPASIDEKFFDGRRAADERSFAAEGLSAGSNGDHILEPVPACCEAAAAASKDSRRMRLIDDEECLELVGNPLKFVQGSDVAIHAVEAFDDDPGAPAASRAPPGAQLIGKGLRLVVPRHSAIRSRQANAFVAARMNQLVVDDDVAALRERREERRVGGKTTAKEERAFGSEKMGRFLLEQFVLWVIAPQEPRGSRANRNAARQRFDDPDLELGARCEREIIVRRKIMALRSDQAAPAPGIIESV